MKIIFHLISEWRVAEFEKAVNDALAKGWGIKLETYRVYYDDSDGTPVHSIVAIEEVKMDGK